MERNLFKDRHPLLYHLAEHSTELAGLALALFLILHLCIFCHLIFEKLNLMGVRTKTVVEAMIRRR